MLPLDVIASLLAKHGYAQQALTMRSLEAREELRVEGFWQDLGAPEIWGDEGSVACIRLSDPDDDARLRRALFQVADEMALRAVGSADSDRWANRLSAKLRS